MVQQTVQDFFKYGPIPASFLFIFVFSACHDSNLKAMVCLGFEPGAAGWKAETNPLSYSGTQRSKILLDRIYP